MKRGRTEESSEERDSSPPVKRIRRTSTEQAVWGSPSSSGSRDRLSLGPTTQTPPRYVRNADPPSAANRMDVDPSGSASNPIDVDDPAGSEDCPIYISDDEDGEAGIGERRIPSSLKGKGRQSSPIDVDEYDSDATVV